MMFKALSAIMCVCAFTFAVFDTHSLAVARDLLFSACLLIQQWRFENVDLFIYFSI